MSNPYQSESPQQQSNWKLWLWFVLGALFMQAAFMGGLFAGWMAIAFLAFGSG